MKSIYTLIFLFAMSTTLFSQVFPVEEVLINGENAKRVIFVFMSDGYQSSEMTKYENDVQDISNDLFQTTPFKEYANFFNVYRIEVPSQESGADHPGTATDVTEPGSHPVIDVNTYFGSTFDFANIHRLLVPTNTGAAFSVLASNVPDYDQGFVLTNSPFYGGSGGSLATSSTHGAASEISIHEIGHSFANLKDEYWAGEQFASESFNMTAESDPSAVKWAIWVGLNGIGVFPYGNSGSQANWHRPHQNCKMRFLNVPFCSVCNQRFIDRIYQLVSPIDAYGPLESEQIYVDTDIDFTSTIIYPNPNTLEVDWEMNGTSLTKDAENFTVTKEMLTEDVNILKLVILDKTPLSKSHEDGYRFEQSWTIMKDFDDDGFTAGEDCDDENPDINPNGIEIPDNGIDEDCDGADDSTSPTNDLDLLPFVLSPNPFDDYISIECDCFGEFNYRVMDQSGKKLSSGKLEINSGAARLNLSSLPSGSYILNILDEAGKAKFERIIIKS